jgi:hypothetical protein
MPIDFETPLTTTINSLSPVTAVLVRAEQYGIAHFPEYGRNGITAVDSTLVPRLWRERGIELHWRDKYGLGVGAFVGCADPELQMMEARPARDSRFRTAFDEALADPEWVAERAERARTEMLEKVGLGAFRMALAWERAMQLPANDHFGRWCEGYVYNFSRRI